MSEIKRVALNTLDPQKVSDKTTKKQCKTIRISVILPESNEDNCPEYNYKVQLAAVKKKFRQVKESNHVESVENGLDLFEEADDDVRRIALEMEAKYGTGMTDDKKKRKGRKDDYADIGMGYDESDSFIDNTDGYDEIIPQHVTTLHGGFYINCGALEFKNDDEASSQSSSSSSSSEDEDGNQTKTSRKRILDTSAESDSEGATTAHCEKKQKIQPPKHTMQQAIKKKLFSSNKIQVKKRRPIDPLKKTVKDLLREKREDLNMTVPSELKEIEENMEKDSLKENKVPMNITSVTDAIESVLKQVIEEDESCVKNQYKKDVDIDIKSPPSMIKNGVENSQPQSMETESSQELIKSEKQEPAKLPENLPSDIIEIVDKIRDAALNYKGEGKKAFFSDEVNSFLLRLERKCKVLGKSSRLRVYEHLCSFVKCRKETLIKRAKNLVLEDEEKRLRMLTNKLKDTIDYMMPSLLVIYEQESQKVLQKKFSKESVNNEENKALKMPRRKFQWTEEAKRLIKDILSIKKRCLLLEGKQKDKLEEQVVDYLRTVILPLWPEGWMYLNNLKKVYNSMSESSKSMNKSPTSNSNKSKHSISNNSLTTSTKVLNSSVGTLGPDVQLFDSKHPLNVPNTTSTSCRVIKENDKSKTDPLNSSYSGKTEISKCVDENDVFKPYAEKYPKSSPQYPKNTSPEIDEPADLSTNSKYNDMFKPYVSAGELSKQSKQSEVFKPYTEKSSHINVQEHMFPNVGRISPKAEKVPPQSDKFVSYTEKYLKHTDIVPSHTEKVSSYFRAENFSTHVENYATHVTEKLVSHSEAHPTTHPEYAENRSIRKENSVYYPEKSILSHRPAHEEKRVVDEEKRVAHEEKRVAHEEKRVAHEEKRVAHEEKRVAHEEKRLTHEEKRLTHEEKRVEYVEKPQVKKEPLYVDKTQVAEKPLFIEKRQFTEKSKYSENSTHLDNPHLETVRIAEKTHVEKPRSTDKLRYEEKLKHAEKSHVEKSRQSEKSQHSEKPRHSEKTQHVEKTRHADKYQCAESILSHSEKYASRVDKHSNREKVPSHSEKLTSHTDFPPLSGKVPSGFSIHARQNDLFKPIESLKDFSKYEMFKPYAETPRPHSGDFSKHHRSKEYYRPNDVLKSQVEKPITKEMSPSRHISHNDIPSSSLKHSRSNDNSSTPKHSRSNDNPSTPKHRLGDLPKMFDDTGVIVKNTHQSKDEVRKLPKDDRKDHNAVISKVSHCQGIVRTEINKNLSDPRTPDLFPDTRATDYFSKAPNKLLDYHASTPAKSEGDDIQMVMENLKALQKLSCSPIKNDNSSSSPVSVIAYNKNFSSKSSSEQKVDSKGDLSGGFQDEFQKQFINSLQQMAANSSTTKSSYNRCS